MLWILLLGGLTDAEIDAIAARHRWPGSETSEKTRATITFRGTVPRAAAEDVYAACLAKNGLAAGRREGYDWWNAELAIGVAAIAEAAWSGSAAIGKEPDFAAVRRAALRNVEEAASRHFAEFSKSFPKPGEAAAAVTAVRKSQADLAAADLAYREALEGLLTQNESKIAETLAMLRARVAAARADLAARRETLASMVTRREEVRLIRRGVLD